MEDIPTKELTECIEDAREELRHCRKRKLRNESLSDDEEVMKCIEKWLESAVEELIKRNC